MVWIGKDLTLAFKRSQVQLPAVPFCLCNETDIASLSACVVVFVAVVVIL